MAYFTKIDLSKQSKLLTGDTANYQGSINLLGGLTGGTGFFYGTVKGSDAILQNEFVTLEQLQLFTGTTSNLILTTTGTTGSSTLGGGYLNIPVYTYTGSTLNLILTTTGTSGAATYDGNYLNIPIYSGGTTASGGTSYIFNTPLMNSGNTVSILSANTSQNGYLTSLDWNTFNNKQNTIILTTTGSTGASTFGGNYLNIPQYSGLTYSGSNGLTKSGNNFTLGGVLTGDTNIYAGSSYNLILSSDTGNITLNHFNTQINYNDSSVQSALQITSTGSFLQSTNLMSQYYGQFIIAPSGIIDVQASMSVSNSGTTSKNIRFTTSDQGISITDDIGKFGLRYSSNYSTSGKTNDRWIPDWGTIKTYVTGTTTGLTTNLILTTTGSTGASTYGGGYLNIPIYSGFTNPMTNIGDIIVATSGGTPNRLGLNGANKLLSSNLTNDNLEYRSLIASGGTISTFTNGNINLFLQDGIFTGTDADITSTLNHYLYKLPVISTNRYLTVSSGSGGTQFIILNSNTGTTNFWYFTGATVTDTSGNILNKIENGGLYILYNNGINWVNFSQSVSPSFFGIPTAPTATSGTSTTQIATTAFVQQAVSSKSQQISYNFYQTTL